MAGRLPGLRFALKCTVHGWLQCFTISGPWLHLQVDAFWCINLPCNCFEWRCVCRCSGLHWNAQLMRDCRAVQFLSHDCICKLITTCPINLPCSCFERQCDCRGSGLPWNAWFMVDCSAMQFWTRIASWHFGLNCSSLWISIIHYVALIYLFQVSHGIIGI